MVDLGHKSWNLHVRCEQVWGHVRVGKPAKPILLFVQDVHEITDPLCRIEYLHRVVHRTRLGAYHGLDVSEPGFPVREPHVLITYTKGASAVVLNVRAPGSNVTLTPRLYQ